MLGKGQREGPESLLWDIENACHHWTSCYLSSSSSLPKKAVLVFTRGKSRPSGWNFASLWTEGSYEKQ
jgi:hypothetical protein